MKASQKRIDKGLYWDRAWSLVEGCSYVSEGCRSCWSAQQAHIRSKQTNPKIRERYSGVTDADGRWNGHVKFLYENLELPLKVKKPQVWSVWNDLLHEKIMLGEIIDALNIMRQCPQHIFFVLTKRPHRISDFIRTVGHPQFKIPDNCWLGVTAENQRTADERIPILWNIPAAVKFVSVEPMLEKIDLSNYLNPRTLPTVEGIKAIRDGITDIPHTDWIICGAETGAGKRPMDIEWATNLRDQCKDAGVPFFFKKHYENGKPTRILDGATHDEYPCDGVL